MSLQTVGEHERALEVQSLWGDSVLDARTLVAQPFVTLGREVPGELDVPARAAPGAFVLARSISAEGCAYEIELSRTFGGRLVRPDGTSVPVSALAEMKHELDAGETLYLSDRGITLKLRYIRRTRPAERAAWSDLDYRWINVLILAFFAHALAVVSVFTTPGARADLAEGVRSMPKSFLELRFASASPQPRRQEPARALGVEGKSGAKNVEPKRRGRLAVHGDPNERDLAKSALSKMFGEKGNARLGEVFGSGGLGGELERASGELSGVRGGESAGLGGLATRGTGPGGGGLSPTSIGTRALATAGRAGGNDDYGSGARDLVKSKGGFEITAEPPIIRGSLEKDVIRRVIKDHMEQIRYCYERELVRVPGLFGKVATEFTIGKDGTVTNAIVAHSTINNDEVARCVIAKIRGWVFPKPGGGGVVVVKYPFIFKTSG